METQQPTARKFILNYGVLLGVASIVLSVILYVLNMHMERSMVSGLLGFAIMIAVIVYGINEFKKTNGNLLSLSQALKVGVGIALIGGIIGAIYNLIFMNFIEPDFMDKMMELQIEKMVEQNPNLTQAQIDTSMEMGKKFSSPMITTAFSVIGSIFFGFVISLIAGFIMKKEQ
jgi:preprotein translocase subunit YajC